jgi:hypothetical protein
MTENGRTMSDGFNRLVNEWYLDVEVAGETRVQTFRPLIDELTDMVRPSMNARGGGGLPSTRNLIDVKALDLLTHIQDVTRAWLNEWGLSGRGSTGMDVRRFVYRANMLHYTGVIETPDWERLTSYPDTWASRIWDLLEPPLQRPLRDSPCPRCGAAKTANEGGETTDALVLEQRYGQEPTAVCRAGDCTAVWVGAEGLKSLGRELGIEFDTTALISEEKVE